MPCCQCLFFGAHSRNWIAYTSTFWKWTGKLCRVKINLYIVNIGLTLTHRLQHLQKNMKAGILPIVQQQKDQIFVVPKPAVQHLSTCLELFSEISRYIIWLMTLPEMGAGWAFEIVYTYTIFRENIRLNMIFASFSLYHNVWPVK